MPIHPTAVIHPNARLAEDVDVGPHAVIDEHVIVGRGCRIWANAYVTGRTTLGENNQIHMGAVIGHWPQHLAYTPSMPSVLEVGAGNVFREQCVIHGSFAEGGKTVIGDGNYFMHQAHVGHDATIGNRTTIGACAIATGHVLVEDGAFVSGLTGIHQFARIGRLTMIGAGSRVSQDVPPYMMVAGGRAEIVGLNVVGLRRAGIPPETRARIKWAYKTIYRQSLTLPQALERLKGEADCVEVERMVEFLEGTQRGICRHHPLGQTKRNQS